MANFSFEHIKNGAQGDLSDPLDPGMTFIARPINFIVDAKSCARHKQNVKSKK